MPPRSRIVLPWPSVTVMNTRRFMKRASFERLFIFGCVSPNVAVVIWLAPAPYFSGSLHRVGAALPEPLIVPVGTDNVGVSLELYFIILMFLKQLGQPQKARIPIGEYRRVELEIDLFPVVFRRCRVQPLCKQTRTEDWKRNSSEKYRWYRINTPPLTLLLLFESFRPPKHGKSELLHHTLNRS